MKIPRALIVVGAIAMSLAASVRAQRGPAGAGAVAQMNLPGDAATGKALVEANKCLDCHRIGDTGSRFGPNLTNVGQLRSPESLEEALTAPDDEVQPEHRQARAVLKDGTTATGRLLNQDTFTVQLITDKEELKSLARSNLREYTILDKGLMPSYKDKLTPQQIADIVNYLSTLRAAPAPRAGGRQ